MRSPNPKQLAAIGLTLALGVLAAVTASTMRSASRAAETAAWVKHTGDVLATAESVLANLQDAVASGRAYLLAGRETYLEPHRLALAEVDASLARLTRLTVDNADQQRRIGRLRPVLERRIALLRESIEQKREAPPMPALPEASRLEAGEALVGEAREILSEIRNEEERLLAVRERDSTTTAAIVKGIVVATGALSAAMLIAAFFALAREIDHRLRAEAGALRHANEIEDLYNRAPCGYHSLDANGVFVHINDTELEWLGYARNEVVGRLRFPDLLTPESVEKFGHTFPVFLREGAIRDVDFAMVRKDGTAIAVSVSATAIRDAAGRHIASRSTVFDVTERKRVEGERDRIFTLSQDLLCIADAEGRFVRINPAWERVLGYALDEVEGRPFLDFVHPDDHLATRAVFAEQLDAGRTIISFENRYRAKDGSFRVLLWNSTPVPAEGRVYASARDITERKSNEDALRAAKRAADAANHELEAFSYSVSHDLRTPLRAIDGFSAALLEDHGAVLDGEGKRHLERVRNATRRMSDLIEDLLKLARLSRLQLVRGRIDLGEVAAEVVAQLRRAEPERAADVRVAGGLVATGDARLVRVVLENLIGNAWKYTRKTERASIEIDRAFVEGETAFVVRDNGAGFDMAHAHRLFGAFQRLHRTDEFEGSGIGLATVQRIVRLHGGRVFAEGAVDAGAAFYFTLESKGESV